ncbi:MAG: ABC transporter [Actinomycetia bacterium]|nr:ABC transporter [Actinomycetes bacterium]
MSERVAALEELHHSLVGAELPLDLGDADDARRTRDELIAQINDYLLLRLRQLDAPLLAVIGGSTGAGKSTLTNSIAGADVSTAGVLRPTTRVPVLVTHPEDQEWFVGDGLLAQLARSFRARPATGGLDLVASPRIPPGLGVLDAPDIDSIEVANHDLATQLLGAADLWLFVTTAARYADAVPWDYLARARERAIALGVVVNRIPPGATGEVVTHLQEMLTANGLGDARLFAITEGESVDSRLPPETIAEIDGWLRGLVTDAESRQNLVRSTVDGAIRSIPGRVGRVGAAMQTQASGAEALRALSRHHYDAALSAIDAELDKGTLLRGEVLERWREHVGTSQLMDGLQRGVGRIRDRIWSVFTGAAAPTDAAQGQLESNLEVLIRQAADQAALETVEGWESLPGGDQVLATSARGIDRASDQLTTRTMGEIREWETRILELVRDQAGNRLAVARTLSLGINGVGLALMVAVFSQTGGLSGGEAGVAAGTAAVSQTVLTAVFGEQSVRTLARTAREDLQLRLAGVFEEERNRFETLLATVVALAGPTGAGKSSLFNALCGADISTTGVRRPTTGAVHGCVWGDGAESLLNWLGVTHRHHLPAGDSGLDGLVLLDLPDFDSTATAHRVEVDRLVELVDLLVWVIDPQK